MSLIKKIGFWSGILSLSAIALPLSAQFYPPYTLFQRYPDASYPYRSFQTNLLNTLDQESQFDNLALELNEAGLKETLASGEYTIFAPTDEAFEALSDEVYDKFTENRLKVLQYHLVAGEISQEQVDSGKVTTLAGIPVAIAKREGKVQINEANAKHPSIRASNGVIIEIDQVLLPPDWSKGGSGVEE